MALSPCYFSILRQVEMMGASWVESFQDFLIELDIKSRMNLMEISIFSLNNVIPRLTKIMDRADKNWAHF